MTFEPIVFKILFLEGAKGEKATFAKDNQDTLPMDITRVPTPEEPEVTFSPPTSTVDKRAAFQGKPVKPADNSAGACEGGSSVEETRGSDTEKGKTNLKAQVLEDKDKFENDKVEEFSQSDEDIGFGIGYDVMCFYTDRSIYTSVRNEYLTHLAIKAYMHAPIYKI